MGEFVIVVLGAICCVLLAIAVLLYVLCRRLWLLMMNVECLCNNVGGLRQQMAAGQHQHG